MFVKAAKKALLTIGAIPIMPLFVILRKTADAYYYSLRSCFGAGYIIGAMHQLVYRGKLRNLK